MAIRSTFAHVLQAPLIETRGNTWLIQSVSQAFLPWMRALDEAGGVASSQCLRAFLPQPISI